MKKYFAVVLASSFLSLAAYADEDCSLALQQVRRAVSQSSEHKQLSLAYLQSTFVAKNAKKLAMNDSAKKNTANTALSE